MATQSTTASLLYSREQGSEFVEFVESDDDYGDGDDDDGAVDLASVSSDGPPVVLPVELCRRHGNETVKMFCETHFVVGCLVCTNVNHNGINCVKSFIPELPPKSDRELAELSHELRTLRNEIKLHRDDTANDLQRLSTERDDILQEIDTYRDSAINHIQKLAENAKISVNDEFKLYERRVTEIINKTEKKFKELDKYIGRLEQDNDNKAQVFVDYVNATNTGYKANELIRRLERSPSLKTIRFQINPGIHDKKEDTISFGTLHMDIQSRTKLDRVTGTQHHDFIGCCALQDGSIVLADKANKILKKVNNKMDVGASLPLPNVPGGLCTVGRHKIAVTLPSRMRVTFTNNNLVMQYGFSVGLFCFSIQYHQGRIYVVCRPTEQPGSSNDEIRIYNTVGVFQANIMKTLRQTGPTSADSVSLIEGPIISVSSLSSDTKYLYVARSDGAILQLDKHHKVVSIKCDEQLKGTSDISCYKSRLYVCNRDKCSVLTMDTKTNELKLLLTADHGVNIPNTVCFNAATSRLVVLLCDTSDVIQFESVVMEM